MVSSITQHTQQSACTRFLTASFVTKIYSLTGHYTRTGKIETCYNNKSKHYEISITELKLKKMFLLKYVISGVPYILF
jgi:hypothetical protein